MSMLWTLLWGELRMQARQPMALLMMIVMPVLMGPGSMVGAGAYQKTLQDVEAVAQGGRSPDGTCDAPALVYVDDIAAAWVKESDCLERVAVKDAVASMRVEGTTITIAFEPSFKSARARGRLEAVARRQYRQLRKAAFEEAKVALPRADGLYTQFIDTAAPAEVAGRALGALLSLVVLFVALLTAAYVALDVFTGERERGTLETLLASGADRRTIALAKYLVVFVQAVVAGWVAIAALAAAQLAGLPLSTEISMLALLGLAVASVVQAITVSGIAIALATAAPSYRSASLLIGAAFLVVMLPAGLPFLPIELDPLLAIVPVGNVGLAARDGLSGMLTASDALLVLASSIGWAALATGIAASRIGREGALFAETDPTALRRAGFHGRDAVGVFLLALLLLWFFGQLAQALDLIGGLLLTQVVFLAGIGVAGVWWVGLPLRQTLSLRLPTPRDGGLALVAGACAPAVGALVFWIQGVILPAPGSLVEAFGDLFAGYSLPTKIAMFAVLPAVCEEILFRGALLGMTRHQPVARRVLVNAFLFGLIHLSIHRLGPTAAIGLLAALAAVRSGSILPAMLIHFVNNAILVSATATENHPPSWPEVALLVLLSSLSFAAVAAMGRGKPS